MSIKSAQALRQSFIRFFQSQGHEWLPSASLLPADDPTLLFTNAGMVPFKEVFLGQVPAPTARVVSVQRCLRAGGKHNDLENVGHTNRHHTFFEMLGNFSFGDYFKEQAIAMAWQYIREVLQLPSERLWITVFHEDEESAAIWRSLGVADARILRIEGEDNFWSMGAVGPCGPCSEIFYDHGEQVSGGLPGTPDEDGDRYVEIWNLVFMQYERGEDGQLKPLKVPCVDTGMGLERVLAVLQGSSDNFATDDFCQLMANLDAIVGQPLPSLARRVIADHARAATFLIFDGVLPASEGRGYVLRRIIRRALRFGYQAGAKAPFLFRLLPAVIASMQVFYPELAQHEARIATIIEREEVAFARTLRQGLEVFDKKQGAGKQLAGALAFELYDTYGFPLDLLKDIAKERQLLLDEQDFVLHLEVQKQRSRQASTFKAKIAIPSQVQSRFLGDRYQHSGPLRELFSQEGEALSHLSAGEEAWMILDETPFYAEAGGQVGDSGDCHTETAKARILDTQKLGSAIGHRLQVLSGRMRVADHVSVAIDQERRLAIMRHHSATHLLHYALRQVLGETVTQQGSWVGPEGFRLDISHPQALSAEELMQVESLVNALILRDLAVHQDTMSLSEAKAKGAIAMFGEKYGDCVRVINFSGTSIELCGGTHVSRSSQVVGFMIQSDSSVASGVRRIEAICGRAYLAKVASLREQQKRLCQALKCDPERLLERVTALQEKAKAAKQPVTSFNIEALFANLQQVGSLYVLLSPPLPLDAKALRVVADQLRERQSHLLFMLQGQGDSRAFLLGVSGDALERIQCSSILVALQRQEGIKCQAGGKAHLMQGKISGETPLIHSVILQTLED